MTGHEVTDSQGILTDGLHRQSVLNENPVAGDIFISIFRHLLHLFVTRIMIGEFLKMHQSEPF